MFDSPSSVTPICGDASKLFQPDTTRRSAESASVVYIVGSRRGALTSSTTEVMSSSLKMFSSKLTHFAPGARKVGQRNERPKPRLGDTSHPETAERTPPKNDGLTNKIIYEI